MRTLLRSNISKEREPLSILMIGQFDTKSMSIVSLWQNGFDVVVIYFPD